MTRFMAAGRFWSDGSVCDAYGAIQCPVFAVGGWADYLSRTAMRLMAGLDVPRRALYATVLLDDVTWGPEDASRHPFRVATDCNRDKVFGDLFRKLAESA